MISPTMPPTRRRRAAAIHQVVDAIHPPLEDRGDVDDHDELRELRRLHAQAGDAHPATRAVEARSEQHHGNQRERQQAQRRPDHDRLPVMAVVHLMRIGIRPADQRERELLEEKQRRALAVWSIPMTADALCHDEARADQRQHRGEQQLVRLEFPAMSIPSSASSGPTITASSQQSSAGVGRHRPHRPGQPAFPAVSPSPPV
jgi:hypothetical protein